MYTFKREISTLADGKIVTADNGIVTVIDGELHVIEGKYHFVYNSGWNIIDKNGDRIKLDKYACPTAEFVNEEIADEKTLEEITVKQKERKEEEK